LIIISCQKINAISIQASENSLKSILLQAELAKWKEFILFFNVHLFFASQLMALLSKNFHSCDGYRGSQANLSNCLRTDCESKMCLWPNTEAWAREMLAEKLLK